MEKIQEHSEQPKSTSNTCLVEKDDSNVTPYSPDMCDNDIQTNQNAEDERVALANLIPNLKLDVVENKKIQKQLKKANTSLAHELKECKSILAETSRTLGESNSIWDSCLIALQNKQTELERNQSIQTIHMLAPKGPTFNGSSTFSNPMYLKKAQFEKPCLYEITYDQSNPANILVLDREETLTLEKEYHEQLAHANEVRKKMWRKSFVKSKPNIFKNIELVDQAWEKHSHNHFRALTALDMEVLIKTCLMPLAIKTLNDSFTFVHELKQEMYDDLKYIESLENEIDELESDKAEFSNMYDILLQECVSNDVMCSYFHSLSDLDAHTELQCLYLHNVEECECLAQKLSKQTEI
ncbi:hypothetical protein Tco_1431865, partial [Tanacetum coccineum]